MADGFVRVLRLIEQQSQGCEFVGGPGWWRASLFSRNSTRARRAAGWLPNLRRQKNSLATDRRSSGFLRTAARVSARYRRSRPALVEHLQIGIDQAGGQSGWNSRS